MWISTDPNAEQDRPFKEVTELSWFFMDTQLALTLSDLMRDAAAMIDSASGVLDSMAVDRLLANLEHQASGLARIALGQEMKDRVRRIEGKWTGLKGEAERGAESGE